MPYTPEQADELLEQRDAWLERESELTIALLRLNFASALAEVSRACSSAMRRRLTKARLS